MKRLISLCLLTILSSGLFAQSTTPPWGNTNGRAVTYSPTFSYRNITDAASATDTVLYTPLADENWIYINTGDTLKGRVCIAILDTTVSGRTKAYTDDFCKRGQKLKIAFATTGLKQDTLDFYGIIQCDSSGSASNKRLNIKKDTTKKYYVVNFIFDGANWVHVSDGGNGLGGSEPTNR